MNDNDLQSTEDALKELIKQTDKAVAKAQAAMGKLATRAISEASPTVPENEPAAAPIMGNTPTVSEG
jgi:hypothetical protein